MDVDDTYTDFAPMHSEDWGAEDVALIFEQAGCGEGSIDQFLSAAIRAVGADYEGCWIRYGRLSAEFTSDITAGAEFEQFNYARPFYADRARIQLAVAVLESISSEALAEGLCKLSANSAFIGWVELVGPSEFRSQLSRWLEWRD